jgi:hypothetical protein
MEKDGSGTIRRGSDSELDLAHLDLSMAAGVIKVKKKSRDGWK